VLGQAEVEAMLDQIGDVGAALQRADPAKLEELYRSLGLEMTYRSAERLVEVTVKPRGSVNVSEGGLDHYVHGLHQQVRLTMGS
jgi:hypothetical protein